MQTDRIIVLAIMFATMALPVRANCVTDFVADDSMLVTVADSVTTDSAKPAKKSLVTKFLDYFNDANKEKKNKKFDFSVIGGPLQHRHKAWVGTGGSGTLPCRP